MKKVYLACDHAGLLLKNSLVKHIQNLGLEAIDLGTTSDESVDYPDFADKLSHAMNGQQSAYGVLVCGSGIGISIAANRHPWIRAALCNACVDEAMLARQHNDANVICFGQKFVTEVEAKKYLDMFLTTEFMGTKEDSTRHKRRVDKLGE